MWTIEAERSSSAQNNQAESYTSVSRLECFAPKCSVQNSQTCIQHENPYDLAWNTKTQAVYLLFFLGSDWLIKKYIWITI